MENRIEPTKKVMTKEKNYKKTWQTKQKPEENNTEQDGK